MLVRKIVHEVLRSQVGALPTRKAFFNAMDELMGVVKAMREEQLTGKQRIVDVQEALVAHDEQVTAVKARMLAT